MRARTVFPLFVVLAMFGGMANADVLINELDCDQVGTDAGEFVELYGPPSTALDGLVVVFLDLYGNRWDLLQPGDGHGSR